MAVSRAHIHEPRRRAIDSPFSGAESRAGADVARVSTRAPEIRGTCRRIG